MNKEIYFNYLPSELIHVVFSYLNDFDSFDSLFKLTKIVHISNVRDILKDNFFWEGMIDQIVLENKYLLDYIIPFVDRPGGNKVRKFYYRLTYYIKVLVAYIKTMNLFKDIDVGLTYIIKKSLPNETRKTIRMKTEEEFSDLSKKYKLYNKVDIRCDGKYLTDISLIYMMGRDFGGRIEYPIIFSKNLINTEDLKYVHISITEFTTNVHFKITEKMGVGSATALFRLEDQELLGLLFHLSFNGAEYEINSTPRMRIFL